MTSQSNESPIDKDWHNSDYEIKEQDRFLPIANGMFKEKKANLNALHTNSYLVGRVMKKRFLKGPNYQKNQKNVYKNV